MNPNFYSFLKHGQWADPNPSVCPCHGTGWFLSDFDVEFQCPQHGQNVPNFYLEDDVEFDLSSHVLKMYRQAFRIFREQARKVGFKGSNQDFIQLCSVATHTIPDSKERWVDAAEAVYVSFSAAYNDNAAHAEGYSCALEREWDNEARAERDALLN